MSFQWKERYMLGIDEIDKQHKKLFEIGNHVYDIAILNDSFDHYDEIMTLLQELYDYTQYHFGYEEELMKAHNYQGCAQQEHEHQFFVQKIESTLSDDIDNHQQETILEILNFLSEWISSHIMISDRKYADDFKARGILL